MSASAPKQGDSHAEMREALRALCRKRQRLLAGIDEARGYPKRSWMRTGGWLAALIPKNMAVIDSHRSVRSWKRSTARAAIRRVRQMYNMNTLLRHI
jgi:hypothetical protein